MLREKISLFYLRKLSVFTLNFFVSIWFKGWCGRDDANLVVTMYEVMSGDTLAWKGASPRQSSTDPSPETDFTGEGGPVKILKVCFCTNSSLGKNFKLVKCDSSWKIQVRGNYRRYRRKVGRWRGEWKSFAKFVLLTNSNRIW